MLDKNEMNFKLKIPASEINIWIDFPGTMHLSIKNLDKWAILRSNFSIDDLMKYIEQRTKDTQAAAFFNGTSDCLPPNKKKT